MAEKPRREGEQISYLYLIAHPLGWRKVGRASDPLRRLRQHQAHAGAPLVGEAIFAVDDMIGAERAVLQALRPHRIMGEWVAIGRDEAIETIEKVATTTALKFPATAQPLRSRVASEREGPFLRLMRRHPEMNVAQLNRFLASNLDVWIAEAVPAHRQNALDQEWKNHVARSFLETARAIERRSVAGS